MQGEAPAGAEQPTKGKAKPKSAKSRVNTPIEKMALGIAHAGLEKKAQDVEIIDVRGKVDYADFVIVMSGRSDRQVAAIARFIDEEVKRQYGVRSLSMEGVPQGVWVLIDFGDIVVHVFHEETRHYYNLESFWMDAKRVRVTEPTRAAKRSAESTR